jgi:dGTPase
MNPTRALLDGVLKYKTLQAETPDEPNHYLYNDQERWLDFTMAGQAFPTELTPGKERNAFRSIECQIMDWADDTAYSLNDIADGIHAGFITVTKLEQWAEMKSLSGADADRIDYLCKAIQEKKVEARLNRSIGEYIAAANLAPNSTFLSAMTRRHQFTLEIDPVLRAQSKLDKKISLDLVFRSPQLQQLDYKADFILTRLFGVLQERYIEGKKGHSLHLMPATLEADIEKAPDASARARLVCDWVASMTDRFAFRTYRRLFDADFGSITDFV